MALTFRNVKGNALTINELDNNFHHFTGSHEVSGSITATDLNLTGEISSSHYFLGTGSLEFKNLPTSDPNVTGSLFTTSSLVAGFSGSARILMVSQG